MSQKISVLFVCLGNICRSPTAHGVFRHMVREAGLEQHFEIDSCGTYAGHAGEPPHLETQDVSRRRGILIDDLRARQLNKQDFERFQYIVAMDRKNLRTLNEHRGDSPAKIFLLRDHDIERDEPSVPDPYYVGGFEGVFDICYRSCEALLAHLIEEHELPRN